MSDMEVGSKKSLAVLKCAHFTCRRKLCAGKCFGEHYKGHIPEHIMFPNTPAESKRKYMASPNKMIYTSSLSAIKIAARFTLLSNKTWDNPFH